MKRNNEFLSLWVVYVLCICVVVVSVDTLTHVFFVLRAGRIQGVCAAGYLCVSGSADVTPQGLPSKWSQCEWRVQCAGPCPPGTINHLPLSLSEHHPHFK